MFDSLAEKLQGTLADVRNHGTLTEADIDGAMREIRLALLEADVNFKVVRQFTAQVKERCSDAEVIGKLNPGQQVVKIVAEELTRLMGGPPTRGEAAHRRRGGRCQVHPELLRETADGDPDGGAAGLGQDDRDGEARALPARGALLVGRRRRLRRLPPGRGRAAREGRRAGRRDRLRAGHRSRPGRDRRVGAGAREAKRARTC